MRNDAHDADKFLQIDYAVLVLVEEVEYVVSKFARLAVREM